MLVAIFSRGMFSSSSSLEVFQICLAVHLRVLYSQPSKKREGWLCEAVGVLCNNFFELSLLLKGMKGNIFG